MDTILKIRGREILDSRGFPTVEVDVITTGGVVGRAAVPSGASTGQHEALEKRDGGSRFLGKGVRDHLLKVLPELDAALHGFSVIDQVGFDERLIGLDGTANKSSLGANLTLAISLATARAGAQVLGIPLYRYLGGLVEGYLPTPLMNVINGGAHADNGLDIQEFMLVPGGFSCFSEALEAGAVIFHTLKKLLLEKGLVTSVGDEGGFAPKLSKNEEAIEWLLLAIEKAGYRVGEQVAVALDVASTELFDGKSYSWQGESLSGEDLIRVYETWLQKYPLVSIEDGWAEDDWECWHKGTEALGERVQLVGDDLFVTQLGRLQRGIEGRCANALLVKMNQVGTVTETIRAARLAQKSGYKIIISHRSGETEDVAISHLAVALGAEQIKTGSLCRSERTAKYNELLRIEEELPYPQFWGRRAFQQK